MTSRRDRRKKRRTNSRKENLDFGVGETAGELKDERKRRNRRTENTKRKNRRI